MMEPIPNSPPRLKHPQIIAAGSWTWCRERGVFFFFLHSYISCYIFKRLAVFTHICHSIILPSAAWWAFTRAQDLFYIRGDFCLILLSHLIIYTPNTRLRLMWCSVLSLPLTRLTPSGRRYFIFYNVATYLYFIFNYNTVAWTQYFKDNPNDIQNCIQKCTFKVSSNSNIG